MLADAETKWKAKVDALVADHSAEWAIEDAKFGKPVISKRGENCISACHRQQGRHGKPMVCETAGLPRLNVCSRLTAHFPCYRGCDKQFKAVTHLLSMEN